MATLFPLKAINVFPKKSDISSIILNRGSIKMAQNIIATNYSIVNMMNNVGSMKKYCNKTVHPKVTLMDNYVSDEILIRVKQNYQLQDGVQRMKETMVRKLLQESCHKAEELVIIDAIQRLNLSHYFRDEIRDVLTKHYEMFDIEKGGCDLHNTALCFRLLRQQGYNVSSDVFSKFRDEDGNFKQELGKDTKGLLSLYEASHLRVRGDDILDSAGEFSRHHLLHNFDSIKPYEASVILSTLSLPCHKSLPMFLAADFLRDFEISMKFLHGCGHESKWMEDVRNLARVDIDKGHMSTEHELTETCRWWEELQLPKELKDARNQPVKWHMWSLACLNGPDMADCRLELTKAITFIYILDDIYDVYGTVEELTLFTKAVTQWECFIDDNLPDYMTITLKALFDITDEICHKIYTKHGMNPKYNIQKVWAEFCNACLVQTKRTASGYMPTTKEYMKNEVATTGSYIAHLHIFFLLGEKLEDMKCNDLVSGHPQISYLAAKILRLWDDLGSSKDEHQKYDGSVVECYLNEHEGSSSESAREYVFAMISDSWKRLNENLMSASPFSVDYKAAIANFARMIPFMYNYDQNHRLPYLERLMKPLLGARKRVSD